MLFFYEGNSLKPGIYEIRNRLSNKSYIGQTVRFKKRWATEWKPQLLKGTSHNEHLKHSFNLYFEQLKHTDFLEFHILEVMENSSKTEREIREEWWIKEYLKNGYDLYNVNLEPTNQKERSCFSHTPEETRQKMREAKLGKPGSNKGKKMPQRSGKNHPYFGKKLSTEHKQKLSAGHKNPFCAEQSRKNILFARGKRKPRAYDNIKLISPTGELFIKIENLIKFCENYDLNYKTMNGVILGKKKSHKGWHLFGVEPGVLSGMKHQGAKIYDLLNNPLINLIGEKIIKIECLKLFCRNYNLNPSSLLNVLNGKAKSHKGWKLQNQ